jgi:hypothetical protein
MNLSATQNQVRRRQTGGRVIRKREVGVGWREPAHIDKQISKSGLEPFPMDVAGATLPGHDSAPSAATNARAPAVIPAQS